MNYDQILMFLLICKKLLIHLQQNDCMFLKEVKENVKKAQIKQKEQYDRKHAAFVTFEICCGFIV